ncbi:MAG: shikimate dehydrogenase [Novosphingobium sp.]
MSRPYAEVIGDPISHSKSPLIHNFWLGKLGIDAEYRHCHVKADELADYFAQRREDAAWQGCNITVPHKVAALAEVDIIGKAAKAIGAINTVTSAGGVLSGHNTDCAGFLEPLGDRSFNVVTVIGAGGAARAVLAGLAARGVQWVTLQNRSLDKAAALLAEFNLTGSAKPLGADVRLAELLVNTSSLGMVGQPALPPVEQDVAPGGLVYDIVYAPLETRLLRAARERGLATIDGLSMLIGQAAAAFEKFFGQPAPRHHDAQLRKLLTS